MSRSHRRTPICGMTTAQSDKACKRRANRQARRAVSALDLTVQDPPGAKLFGDPWKSDKDGKQWIDASRFPEEMRK